MAFSGGAKRKSWRGVSGVFLLASFVFSLPEKTSEGRVRWIAGSNEHKSLGCTKCDCFGIFVAYGGRKTTKAAVSSLWEVFCRSVVSRPLIRKCFGVISFDVLGRNQGPIMFSFKIDTSRTKFQAVFHHC